MPVHIHTANRLDQLPSELVFHVARFVPKVQERKHLFQAYYQNDWSQQTYEHKWLEQELELAIERAHAGLLRPTQQAHASLQGRTQSLMSDGLPRDATPEAVLGYLRSRYPHETTHHVSGGLDAHVRDRINQAIEWMRPAYTVDEVVALLLIMIWVEASLGALRIGANLAGRIAGSTRAYSELQPYVPLAEKARRGAIIVGSCAAMLGCTLGACLLGCWLTVSMGVLPAAIIIGIAGRLGFCDLFDSTTAPQLTPLASFGVLAGVLAVGVVVIALWAYFNRDSLPDGALWASLTARFSEQAHTEIDHLAEHARDTLARA